MDEIWSNEDEIHANTSEIQTKINQMQHFGVFQIFWNISYVFRIVSWGSGAFQIRIGAFRRRLELHVAAIGSCGAEVKFLGAVIKVAYASIKSRMR